MLRRCPRRALKAGRLPKLMQRLQDGAHPQRLWDEPVDAVMDTLVVVDQQIPGREHDDLDRRTLTPTRLRDLKAAIAWHGEIGQDDIEVLVTKRPDRLRTVLDGGDHEPIISEDFAEEIADILLVLSDEDANIGL